DTSTLACEPPPTSSSQDRTVLSARQSAAAAFTRSRAYTLERPGDSGGVATTCAGDKPASASDERPCGSTTGEHARVCRSAWQRLLPHAVLYARSDGPRSRSSDG